jgi:hypothetical protein
MEQGRILPTRDILGTTFIVDVQKDQLREQGNPDNTIGFNEMGYSKEGYRFHYDPILKNLPESFTAEYEVISIPNLTELDPMGMAMKYGKTEAEIAGKTDVEVMVDQKQLALRVEYGQLPVFEIVGHPFYVDLVMNSLRPKDDFAPTAGIRFEEIEDYFIESTNHYLIPYNPITHSLEELDPETIKAVPKGIVFVEIPLPQPLDPVAYARIHGFDRDQTLRETPLQMKMKAVEVPWYNTPLRRIIADNLKRDLIKQLTQSSNKPQRKRSRGI